MLSSVLLVLACVLTLGASVAQADDVVLRPPTHVRAGGGEHRALAPATPEGTGGDVIPLPTPVKGPRNPRVPPIWAPLTGDDGPGAFARVWMQAQLFLHLGAASQ
jgi:hypothetical protein